MIRCSISNVMYQPYALDLRRELRGILIRGGAKGKRMALPNAEIMIHQLGYARQWDSNGPASDIKNYVRLYAKQ